MAAQTGQVPARRARALAVMLGVAAFVVTADAVSKALVLRDLPGRPPVRLLDDRLFRAPGPFRGSVVDWLNLPHFAWTFNVADAAVTFAAVLIGILTLLGVRIDGTSPADGARDAHGERAPGTP